MFYLLLIISHFFMNLSFRYKDRNLQGLIVALPKLPINKQQTNTSKQIARQAGSLATLPWTYPVTAQWMPYMRWMQPTSIKHFNRAINA